MHQEFLVKRVFSVLVSFLYSFLAIFWGKNIKDIKLKLGTFFNIILLYLYL